MAREYYSLDFYDGEDRSAQDFLVSYMNETGDEPLQVFERAEDRGAYIVAIFSSEEG